MLRDTIEDIRGILPSEIRFPYFPDREAAWLMSERMGVDGTLGALRGSDMARLLSRPLMRSYIAACGDGVIRRDAMAALADPMIDDQEVLGAGFKAALQEIYAKAWLDFTLSFECWGSDRRYWSYYQTSRRGHNLVLQVNFPTEHADYFGRFAPALKRSQFEYANHPVRQTGAPTLAWVRIDLDEDEGEALIEEVQSDWVRAVRWHAAAPQGLRDRELRNLEYYARFVATRYAKIWPNVALFAALHFLRREFGVARVFMHQPRAGVRLKSIFGSAPPRSLYSALPKSFCFAPTREAPAFLERVQRKNLRALRRGGDPVFWKLEF